MRKTEREGERGRENEGDGRKSVIGKGWTPSERARFRSRTLGISRGNPQKQSCIGYCGVSAYKWMCIRGWIFWSLAGRSESAGKFARLKCHVCQHRMTTTREMSGKPRRVSPISFLLSDYMMGRGTESERECKVERKGETTRRESREALLYFTLWF